MNVIVNLMTKNVTRIKIEITINAGVSRKGQKDIMCGKNVMFENLLHVVVKIYSKYYWQFSYHLRWNDGRGTVRELSYPTYVAQWSNKNHSNKNWSHKNYPNEKYNFLYLTVFKTYYFFDDTVNIKKLDPSKFKMEISIWY